MHEQQHLAIQKSSEGRVGFFSGLGCPGRIARYGRAGERSLSLLHIATPPPPPPPPSHGQKTAPRDKNKGRRNEGVAKRSKLTLVRLGV
jgi:hypothetical protein